MHEGAGLPHPPQSRSQAATPSAEAAARHLTVSSSCGEKHVSQIQNVSMGPLFFCVSSSPAAAAPTPPARTGGRCARLRSRAGGGRARCTQAGRRGAEGLTHPPNWPQTLQGFTQEDLSMSVLEQICSRDRSDIPAGHRSCLQRGIQKDSIAAFWRACLSSKVAQTWQSAAQGTSE